MLVEHLAGEGIRDPRVLEAMARVPREAFVPPDLRHRSYDDCALPLACGQTISQPLIVAMMTEALGLTGSERVLEIGTGSGYQCAVLAELAQSVVSIERHEHLALEARARLAQLGYRNVLVISGDGTLGDPEHAPFDRIIITAAAREAPPRLLEQLADGGVMVLPLGDERGQTLKRLHKHGGQITTTNLTSCRFVPMIGSSGWPGSA
ncbi:MAG: protein-L-isoaspartate(D-aspartate) O-methyltransferase [Pirellulales bacterium]|nr:protein-L-isoaspartate(D-aspartate) O-methyltransferase [Pirellulales bacterium]